MKHLEQIDYESRYGYVRGNPRHDRQKYTFEDFEARVMCHENDHLNGVLYTDIATDIMTLEEATRLAEEEN